MAKISLKSKIKFMEEWCKKQGLALELKGTVGFGRECVGILGLDSDGEPGTYPNYDFWGDDSKDKFELKKNNVSFIPPKAYHKHPCVAVLGRDEESIDQLYQWIKWFDKNKFVYRMVKLPVTDPILVLLGQNRAHFLRREE